MTEMEIRPHPVMILKFLSPYLFVLILPVARQIFNLKVGRGFPRFFILELILLFTVIIVSVLKWHRYRLYISDKYVRFTKGLFFRIEATIPKNRIASMFLEKKPLLWFIGGVVLRFDTEAGKPRKNDFQMTVKVKDVSLLFTLLPFKGNYFKHYHAPTLKIIIMALANTSTTTGLLIAAPIVNNAGKLLGKSMSDIWVSISSVSSALEFIIPPIASTISIIILIGFAVSFLSTVFKCVPFDLYIKGDLITSVSGLISKRYTSFKREAINNLIIIKSPIMRILRHSTVKVNVAGYGKHKGEIAVFIPAANKRELAGLIEDFLPSMVSKPIMLRPPYRSLRRYLTQPFVLFFIISLVSIFLSNRFTNFKDFIEFMTIISFIVLAVFGELSLKKYVQSGIAFGEHVAVLSSRKFSLVELRCKFEKIGVIKISQTPFDRKHNLCKMKLTIRSESADSITVANLDYSELKVALLNNYNIAI